MRNRPLSENCNQYLKFIENTSGPNKRYPEPLGYCGLYLRKQRGRPSHQEASLFPTENMQRAGNSLWGEGNSDFQDTKATFSQRKEIGASGEIFFILFGGAKEKHFFLGRCVMECITILIIWMAISWRGRHKELCVIGAGQHSDRPSA